MMEHDHARCTVHDGIASYPADVCGDPGHPLAVDEVGWCPVCQHVHDAEPRVRLSLRQGPGEPWEPVETGGVRWPDVIVQLTGHDGNAVAIMGRVRRAIDAVHGPEAARAYVDEATAARSYDELLQVTARTVVVE